MMNRFFSLVFLFLLSHSLEGVVIFREVSNLDIVDNSGGFIRLNLDIDNDGVTDFFTTPRGGELSLVPTGENQILAVRATPPDLGRSIHALVLGELISGSPSVPLSWNGLDDIENTLDDGGL